MRMDVGHDPCDGFGFCEKGAAQVRWMDDDDRLEMLPDPVPAELERVAEAAAWFCPVAALRVLA